MAPNSVNRPAKDGKLFGGLGLCLPRMITARVEERKTCNCDEAIGALIELLAFMESASPPQALPTFALLCNPRQG